MFGVNAYVSLLIFVHMEGMAISSLLLMITLGMVMFTLCIRILMAWINSRNLSKNS